MKRPTTPAFRLKLSEILCFVFTLILFCPGDSLIAYAQSTTDKPLDAVFYPENGCPVQLTKVNAILEVDPFGAPTATKIYLTYTNNASRAISAVKFRCRYSDVEGKDKGTFHAHDGFAVGPGESRTQKWKREGGLHPGIAGFQIRILQVKFSDGSLWESSRMKELINPQGGGDQQETQVPQQQSVQQQTPAASQTPAQSSFEQPVQAQPQTPPSEQQGQQQEGFDKSKELPW
jgi:hypothetical protein